jgi:hypothetical protein
MRQVSNKSIVQFLDWNPRLEAQQWNKGPMRKTAATTVDGEDFQQDRQESLSAGVVIENRVVGSSTGLRKEGDWTFWQVRPPL